MDSLTIALKALVSKNQKEINLTYLPLEEGYNDPLVLNLGPLFTRVYN